MAPGWIVVICIVGFWVISTTVFSVYLYKNLKKDEQLKQAIQEREECLEKLDSQINSLHLQLTDLTDSYNRICVDKQYANDELQQLVQRCDIQQTQLNNLNSAIKEKKDFIENGIKQLATAKHNELELRLENATKEADEKITKAQQDCELLIAKYTYAAKDAKDQYLAVISALNKVEENLVNIINISDADKSDIELLTTYVIPKIQHTDTIYKLIWSEYYQAPTNELLTNILPNNDCSGIYKITNLENKKCYIGRSTNVKRRLIDHIKSSIGIGTIANQKIHDVMREEGLWNFSFELLEECSKDQLGDREKYYIDFSQSNQPQFGYNVVSGSAFKG